VLYKPFHFAQLCLIYPVSVVEGSCIFRRLFIPSAVDFAENSSRLIVSLSFEKETRSAIRERHCLVWSVRNNPRPRPVCSPLSRFFFLSLFLAVCLEFAEVRGPTRTSGATTKDEGPLRALPLFCHHGCNNNHPTDQLTRTCGMKRKKEEGAKKNERIEGGRTRRVERHADVSAAAQTHPDI